MIKGPTVKDLGLSIHLRTNLFLGTQELGGKILRSLIESDGVFVPEIFDSGWRSQGRWVQFDPDDLSSVLKSWTDTYSPGIIARRRRPLKVFFHVFSTESLMFDHVSLSLALDKTGHIDSKSVSTFTKHVGVPSLLEVARKLYSIVQPDWARIQNDFYEHQQGEVLNNEGYPTGYDAPRGPARKALQGLFWANFFGPEYVEVFGRGRLLSAPCHRVDELPDRGFLLILSESPFDASTNEYRAKKQELYDYLGEDAFTGKLLPRFRTGPGRKMRDARPLIETGGTRDDIFH